MSPSHLDRLAYRMLGSVADAEDAVQEARLRLLKQQVPPENEEAWMFRVVTNIALDKLRERKRQREGYPGPWLPEPLPTPAAEPEALAELAESLSMGLLLMLERLRPVERAVFVLREGFDLGFDDIALLVDASPASCRQRYRRAKAHLAGAARSDAESAEAATEVTAEDPAEHLAAQRQMLERLMTAVAERDLVSLVALFADDCIAYADGGGVVSAAIRPVTDPDRIARVTLHLAAKLEAAGEIGFHWVNLNGGVGLLVSANGSLHSSLQVELAHGRIRRLYIMRNPEKLAHLRFELTSKLSH